MTNFNGKTNKSNLKIRLIAFYLPQFHPIPENNEWWGNGFTEWTNVKKARPLFINHYQPHIPTELGYYDLRDPEIRKIQADLALQHGIEGFCYWHYWFAGKQLLERPFNEVLNSGKPNFPFCLGWANDSWTGIWHGCPGKILIKQTYPGRKDDEEHFYALLNAFQDSRYITISDKPIFIIHRPDQLKEPKTFIDQWNKLAIKNGLKGIYFIAIASSIDMFHEKDIYDAVIFNTPSIILFKILKIFNNPLAFFDRTVLRLFKKSLKEFFQSYSSPYTEQYKNYIKHALLPLPHNLDTFPCVIPNWDNTPRCGINGVVLHESTPDLFRIHLHESIAQIKNRVTDKKVIFIKSWNEWGEGNYLEPDQKYGREYLRVCKEETKNNFNIKSTIELTR